MKRRKADGTDGSLLQSLPWTLAALGFSALAHVPYIPIWISAALLVCGAINAPAPPGVSVVGGDRAWLEPADVTRLVAEAFG